MGGLVLARPKRIEATVTGVYGMLHTDRGDFRTKPPSHVSIESSQLILYLPLPKPLPPSSAKWTGFTLHFGDETIELPIETPKDERYESLTVVQRVSITLT